MWLLIIFLTVLFSIILPFYKAEDFIERLSQINSSNKNKQKKKKNVQIEERDQLVQILKENIGNIIAIESKDFTHVHQNSLRTDNQTIMGKVLEVDEAWINLEYDSRQFVKKEPLDQLIFSIGCIERFTVITDPD